MEPTSAPQSSTPIQSGSTPLPAALGERSNVPSSPPPSAPPPSTGGSSNSKMPMIALGAGVIIIVGLVSVLIMRPKAPVQQPPAEGAVTVTEAPAQPVGKGKLMLQTAAGASAKVGVPLTLTLVADSDNQSVAGYDIVLKYDPEVVMYNSNKSLIDDFDVVSRKEDKTVTLIGFKKLSATTPQVFANTNVMEITFTPTKAGTASFEIEFVPNATTDSNLMIESAQPTDILGSVEGANITVAP